MKLSDQVCTLEQAKRLKELGVLQNSEWHWIYPVKESVISSLIDIYHKSFVVEILSDTNENRWNAQFPHSHAAAYSVAEMGVMLHWGNDTMYHTNQGWGTFDMDETHIGPYPTEAEARGALLIHLLETNAITADEVNKRLENGN